ncbi:TerB family tellurite resistance protein [Mucilaginibacter terrae]|uniref:TerB family tellurite resistance protein n=1 Tax=Mucilaginibacter terrae TaxID=1955052 RepID=A0ABU3GWZ0_9SPHI|nr:TerB family tellurite resistance protein [Mucilaginibacter terrae]MDT3404278.1 hypothetical protein [Mucilaginibacter terrae]
MKNMKSKVIIVTLSILVGMGSVKGYAQGTEMQQLLLNIEKLTQLKSILSDMKTGYQVYQQGYGMISNLSKGNFDLHDIYLSGLLAVSPAVRNYQRIPEIISMQTSLIKEYKSATGRFRQSGTFSAAELGYLSNVYQKLIGESLQGIEELIQVTSAGKLRMSDAERLQAIDRIYSGTTDKLNFLRSFNRQGIILSLRRTRDLENTRQLKRLYGLTN